MHFLHESLSCIANFGSKTVANTFLKFSSNKTFSIINFYENEEDSRKSTFLVEQASFLVSHEGFCKGKQMPG